MDKDIITIVSGLPRSGTSMMMRMLEKGGMKVVVDNVRKSDEDNPKGYYEVEKVKKIKEDASWLEKTKGKVFKMVSMLLYHLPLNRKYKIIFMRRKMDEMLASQRKMLQRQGKLNENSTDGEMKKLFEKHLYDIEKWLGAQENMYVLYVSYNDIVHNPLPTLKRVNSHLGDELDVEKMAQVIDNSLYRQRN